MMTSEDFLGLKIFWFSGGSSGTEDFLGSREQPVTVTNNRRLWRLSFMHARFISLQCEASKNAFLLHESSFLLGIYTLAFALSLFPLSLSFFPFPLSLSPSVSFFPSFFFLSLFPFPSFCFLFSFFLLSFSLSLFQDMVEKVTPLV